MSRKLLYLSTCLICGVIMSDDPGSLNHDCGGDCLMCMADAGDMDCLISAFNIMREQQKLVPDLIQALRNLVDCYNTDEIPNSVDILIANQCLDKAEGKL